MRSQHTRKGMRREALGPRQAEKDADNMGVGGARRTEGSRRKNSGRVVGGSGVQGGQGQGSREQLLV